MFLVQVKVKLHFNKSWKKYVDFVDNLAFVHSNFSQVWVFRDLPSAYDETFAKIVNSF